MDIFMIACSIVMIVYIVILIINTRAARANEKACAAIVVKVIEQNKILAKQIDQQDEMIRMLVERLK